MKKIITLHSVKWLLPLLAIVILMGLTACTSTKTTTTPEILYAPVISFVNAYITEAGGSTSGVNVNFFTRISERPDTLPVNIIYYFDATPPTTPGVPAYSEPGTYVVQEPIEEPVIWKDIPPGRHVFSAQLVKPDDNTPLVPPVTA
jgi:hypothetical protein